MSATAAGVAAAFGRPQAALHRVLPSGELMVSDSMEREGKWEGFSSARLARGAKDG